MSRGRGKPNAPSGWGPASISDRGRDDAKTAKGDRCLIGSLAVGEWCLVQEATAGIEPANRGFADPCLTTWLRRHFLMQAPPACRPMRLAIGKRRFIQSGRWDLNPRPSPWQGDVLPLNYTRLQRGKHTVHECESQAKAHFRCSVLLDSNAGMLYPSSRPTGRSVLGTSVKDCL